MKHFILAHAESRRRALAAVTEAPDGYVVTVKPPTRNLAQNALMWIILDAFSEQLTWPVNGKMEHISPEEWKDVLSAAYTNETQRIALGLNGGMVILGMRTSKFTKSEFAEFLDFLQATAIDRGVAIGKDEE